MKTKQEFIDEAAIQTNAQLQATVGGRLGYFVDMAYDDAEALWEERERRRKEDKKEWPVNTMYESFEKAYPWAPVGVEFDEFKRTYFFERLGDGYKNTYVNDLFKAYSAGFHDCNDRYAG